MECRERMEFPAKGQEIFSFREGNSEFNVTSLGRLPDLSDRLAGLGLALIPCFSWLLPKSAIINL